MLQFLKHNKLNLTKIAYWNSWKYQHSNSFRNFDLPRSKTETKWTMQSA